MQKIRLKMIDAIEASALVMIFFCVTSAHGKSMHSALTYDITLQQHPIGTYAVQREKIEIEGELLESRRESVRIDFTYNDQHYVFSSESEIRLDTQGLRQAQHYFYDNGTRYSVRGQRFANELWFTAERVRTQEELDSKALDDFLLTLAAETIPYLGWGLAIFGNADDEGSLRISLDRFDVSSSELSRLFVTLQPSAEVRTFNVFDTESLEFVSTKVKALSQETITIDGQPYRCYVVSVKLGNSVEKTVWTAIDALGPFLVKEAGVDEDGPYEVILSSVVTVDTD